PSVRMRRGPGNRLALATRWGDLPRGLLPVMLASFLGLSVEQQSWIAVAAVLGHLYPLYFRFRGGKGVATAAGALLGLYPPAAIVAVTGWLVMFKLSRTSALAAVAALP